MSKVKTLVLLILFSSLSLGANAKMCATFYENLGIIKAKRPLLVSGYHYTNGFLPSNELWGKIRPYYPTGLSYKTVETRHLDQELSKECPTFAFVHAMESAYANHPTHPELIEFNTEFLIGKKLKHYIEKAVDPDHSFFTYEDPFAPMREGGEFYNVLDVIINSGLAPEKRWISLQDLKFWPFVEGIPDEPTIYRMIEKRIDDENFRIANNIKPAPRKTDPRYRAWKERYVEAIFQDIVGQYVGVLPKPFEWNGKYDLTPVSFSKIRGPSRTQVPKLIYMSPFPYDNYINTQRANEFFKSAYADAAKPFTHSQSNLRTFLLSISEGIAEGKGVVIDMNGKTPGFGHAFAVTDVEVRDGLVVALKLKNSYTHWGQNGYGWISANEVFKNARRAWIFDVIH